MVLPNTDTLMGGTEVEVGRYESRYVAVEQREYWPVQGLGDYLLLMFQRIGKGRLCSHRGIRVRVYCRESQPVNNLGWVAGLQLNPRAISFIKNWLLSLLSLLPRIGWVSWGEYDCRVVWSIPFRDGIGVIQYTIPIKQGLLIVLDWSKVMLVHPQL